MSPELILTFIIGILGGVAVGVQTPITSMISSRLGNIAGSFFVHTSGTVIAGIALLLRGGENIRAVRELPWWMFGVGAFGVYVLVSISHSVPRIGATAATSLIIAGQLVVGMMIDHFGWLEVSVRPVDPTRILAVGLLFLGAYLMIR
jgi:transporter family-2 protein